MWRKWLEGVAFSLTVKRTPLWRPGRTRSSASLKRPSSRTAIWIPTLSSKEPEHRWQNLHECHELYCAGHMMEAAVAYYEATGKDKLLQVTQRLADAIIDRFGPQEGKEHGIPGHQEVEIGLMKLYHYHGKEKYKAMAGIFWRKEERSRLLLSGKVKRGCSIGDSIAWKSWTFPTTRPTRRFMSRKEAVGHAVRALYMYTAMADLAGTDRDERLYQACRRLWDNVVNRKLYITGGIGGNAEGEAFFQRVRAANDMAYAETCASIAMVFFCTPDAGDGAGRGLCGHHGKGTLQQHGERNAVGREKSIFMSIRWNVSRRYPESCSDTSMRCPKGRGGMPAPAALQSGKDDHLPGEILLERERFHHLFPPDDRPEGRAAEGGNHHRDTLSLGRETTYRVTPRTEQEFTLAIHVPYYVDWEQDRTSLTVNGEQIDARELLQKGYVYIRRNGCRRSGGGTLPYGSAQGLMPTREYGRMQAVWPFAGPCSVLLRGRGQRGNDPEPADSKAGTATPFVCEEGVLKGNTLLKMEGSRMVGGRRALQREAAGKGKGNADGHSLLRLGKPGRDTDACVDAGRVKKCIVYKRIYSKKVLLGCF